MPVARCYVVRRHDPQAAPTPTPRRAPTRAPPRRPRPAAPPPLRDGFAASRTGHYGPTSTWTAFRAIEPERRIDYVLVSPALTVQSHGILPDSWDGRFPSDHLPVLAALANACRP